MDCIYVLNKDGQPLMPSRRWKHIKKLIKAGQVKKLSSKPFMVQLLYDSPSIVQELTLGVDPGRTNIGVSVIKNDGECIYSAELETRNKEIPQLMEERKLHRQKHRHYGRRTVRQRRAKKSDTCFDDEERERILPGCKEPIVLHRIKNKEAKFNNRIRKEGWLTPTAKQLLDTHENLIRKIKKILPIRRIVVELNQFDFMAMDNPNVQKWQYQKGPLYNKGSIEEAIHELQDGKCLLCDNEIEHYHHVVPRSKRGSNTIQNIAGMCSHCHHEVHTDKEVESHLKSIKEGMNKRYGALSVLHQIIPFLIKRLAQNNEVYITGGYSTKQFRIEHNIDKEHHLDAYCIACSILENPKIKTSVPFKLKQYRRHDRQACHQEMLNRNYYSNGVKVASNRSKATEQKTPSLKEFRETCMYKKLSQLKVKEHKPIYKNRNRIMPGATMKYSNEYFVLKRSQGTNKRHEPQYYHSEGKKKYRVKKCKLIRKAGGIVYV